MKRALLIAALSVAALITARAHAEPARRVDVRVVDIAGKWAYLSAGTGKGVRPGSRVFFGKVERKVERATHSYAVVSARTLRVGERGIAQTSAAPKDQSERLPKPRELDAFQGMWPETERPADSQHPDPVPLGGTLIGQKKRATATLSAAGSAFAPLEGNKKIASRAELRARVDAALVESWPLVLVADVGVQRWFGRYTTGVARGDSRPIQRIRELGLIAGAQDDWRGQVGRLRYAAVNLGPLDGARVETVRYGALRIAGFGGLLPDPIDGRAALGAGRFGVEANFVGESMRSRPEVTVVAQGSVFDGKLDERRLYAQMQLWPGAHRFGAYAQLAFFDKNNPWSRPAADLAAAGVDADFRFGDVRLGARFDMRKPERSFWLDNALPRTWLCSTGNAADANSVACSRSDDTRYVAQAYGGWDLKVVQFDAGGSYATSSDDALGNNTYVYGTARFPRVGRYDFALGGSHESGSLFLNSTVRADVGAGFFDERLHLNLYYRPAYRRYGASLDPLWEQGAGASMLLQPTPKFAFNVFGDLRLGDVDAALVMAMAIMRLGT